MGIFYSRERGRFSVRTLPKDQPGVVLFIGGAEEVIPDDEIPDLVAALQNYMSRRANELSRGAKRG